MKNRSSITTRYKSFYLKLILLLAATAIGLLLSHCSKGQAVQSMVKNQPFPYPQGVAMDTLLYKSVRAKLQAADQLKASANLTIEQLQADLLLTSRSVDKYRSLSLYDTKKLDSLASIELQLQGDIAVLHKQQDQTDSVRVILLRSFPLAVVRALWTAPDRTVAEATVDRIKLLRRRKWHWLGVGSGIGFIGGLLLVFH